MPILFNSLLKSAGIDPTSVRLMRHQDGRADKDRTPYRLWRDCRDSDFITYQSRQAVDDLRFRAAYWASFVVPPTKETLFVALYEVGEPSPGEQGVPRVQIRNAREEGPYNVYPLRKSDLLAEFEAKLVIDWGRGALAWVQRADNQNKKVLEIRPAFIEEAWPGYLQFLKPLSEISDLPPAWVLLLKEARGIYLLTCPRTKEHYIGKASGNEGFYGRWLEHVSTGGDAVGLQSREASDYQVTILEVAGSAASESDVAKLEQLWMKKLQSGIMGLNFSFSGNRPQNAEAPSSTTPISLP
jgi:hypothetical protein